LEYHRKREINNGNLLAGLVEFTSNISKPFIPENKTIRVDVLSKNDEKMVIVQNLEKMDVNVTIKIPGEKFLSLIEQFSGDKVKCKNIGAGVEFELKLYPKEVRVYRA